MDRFTGSKYNPDVRNVAEIAKLVRADIKTAIKAGELPVGLKTSVRIERYSMGQSIRISITACPGLTIVPVERIAAEIERPHVHLEGPWQTEEARAIEKRLERLLNAYNRGEYESETDYCNELFHASVDFDYEFRKADRAATVARLAAAVPVVAAPANDVAAPVAEPVEPPAGCFPVSLYA
jgi:hypothetical protein